MSIPCKACGAARTSPCAPNCGRKAKQVIVMRTDLNMRKGKMIAQGAHASVGVVLACEQELSAIRDGKEYGYSSPDPAWLEPYLAWRDGTFTKICVSVDSEAELLEIKEAAFMYDLPFKLITDNGLTEFNGVPTNTCLAIGPAWADDIDKITGHLKLL